MALVPHPSSSDQNGNKGAIVAVRGAQELTQEEYEKRIKDVSKFAMPATILDCDISHSSCKSMLIAICPLTRIMNVACSNAGAGSGEFHMYRQVLSLTLTESSFAPSFQYSASKSHQQQCLFSHKKTTHFPYPVCLLATTAVSLSACMALSNQAFTIMHVCVWQLCQQHLCQHPCKPCG